MPFNLLKRYCYACHGLLQKRLRQYTCSNVQCPNAQGITTPSQAKNKQIPQLAQKELRAPCPNIQANTLICIVHCIYADCQERHAKECHAPGPVNSVRAGSAQLTVAKFHPDIHLCCEKEAQSQIKLRKNPITDQIEQIMNYPSSWLFHRVGHTLSSQQPDWIPDLLQSS